MINDALHFQSIFFRKFFFNSPQLRKTLFLIFSEFSVSSIFCLAFYQRDLKEKTNKTAIKSNANNAEFDWSHLRVFAPFSIIYSFPFHFLSDSNFDSRSLFFFAKAALFKLAFFNTVHQLFNHLSLLLISLRSSCVSVLVCILTISLSFSPFEFSVYLFTELCTSLSSH